MKKMEVRDLELEISKIIASYLASNNKDQCVSERVSIAMRITSIAIKEIAELSLSPSK